MMLRPLTFALAFVGGWYALYRYAERQREAGRAPAKPRYLQTWEGEGGGVPVGGSRTAAQVSPEDAPGHGGRTAQAGSTTPSAGNALASADDASPSVANRSPSTARLPSQ